MKEFSVSKFLSDTVINDDVCITGPSAAHGNFRAFSLELRNEFIVKGELITSRGVVKTTSNLQVGSNLISAGDIIVQKDCRVSGNIIGENIKLLGLNISAQSIKAATVSLSGNITIQNGINESKSIYLVLDPRKRKVEIGGDLESPFITVLFGSFYTKWLNLSDIILKRIGRKVVRVKREYNIGNLSIKTKKLTIKTCFSPERVEIILNQANIITKEIEIVKID